MQIIGYKFKIYSPPPIFVPSALRSAGALGLKLMSWNSKSTQHFAPIGASGTYQHPAALRRLRVNNISKSLLRRLAWC